MAGRQYAMVMDLNKCIGCQTCTLACKKQWTDRDGMPHMYWNNVETRPGSGYPRGWMEAGGGFEARRHLRPSPLPAEDDYGVPFEYDYAQRLYQGGGKPVMPHREPTGSPNWDEDVGRTNGRDPSFFYLPRVCNHCTHPACAAACPRGAIYKREEDGIVLIDQERCRGYRHCIQACPYKKIYYNTVTGTSQKCIFCYPRLEQGLPQACAAQCPGRVRFVGLRDDPLSPVHKLVDHYRVALPLLADRGTHPNVFYVPPVCPPSAGHPDRELLHDTRLARETLTSLFGPEVLDVLRRMEREIRRVQAGRKSELLQLLIGRNEGVRFRVAPARDTRGVLVAGGRRAPVRTGGPGLTPPGPACPPQTPPGAKGAVG